MGTICEDEIKSLQLSPAEETPVSQEKLEDMKKRHLVVVLIGHVDAGKSTTGGQILFLSGQVDDRTIKKYEKEAKDKNRESWYMAYIMDTNEEERAKGITIDVGKAYFETQTTRFTLLDAPGHKRYVPNMISGASQADVGILMVSARKGEFEAGYVGGTREHVLLAKTLGVTKLIVAINKMDDSTVKWSKERYDEIESKMRPFLKSSGYKVGRDVHFLPISGLFGENMQARVGRGICQWWDGFCLFEVLDSVESPPRDRDGPFRLPVTGKYKDMGSLVLMGKVESGSIRKGDDTMLVVGAKVVNVRVEAIYCGEDSNEEVIAGPGEILRIRLSGAGIEESDVFAGSVLCGVRDPIRFAYEFTAQLKIVGLKENSLFTAGYRAVLHIHSATEDCEIAKMMDQRVVFAKNGDEVVCRVKVKAGVCVEKFSDFPQLGRFTIRDEGGTIAVGKVVDLSA